MRSEQAHGDKRSEQPKRRPEKLDRLLEAAPSSEAAWEQTLESADGLGDELQRFNVKFDQVDAALAEQVAKGEITPEQQAFILAQVKTEETKLLDKYFDPSEKMEFDRAQAEASLEKSKVKTLQGEAQAAKNEVTVQRLKRTGALVGGAVGSTLDIPAEIMEKNIAPLIAKSRPALQEMTGAMTDAVSKTIDDVAPSMTKAMEDAVRQVGKSGAEVYGKVLDETATGMGKAVKHVGREGAETMKHVLTAVPAGLGKGAGLMIRNFIMALAGKE